jgi:hypothetical protein
LKTLRIVGLVAIAIVLSTSVLQASILSEEEAYWYVGESGLETKFNPDGNWLSEMAAAGALRVRVQQTIYDQAQSAAMLLRNGDGEHTGYLYVYSISNLRVGNPLDNEDWGITQFSANWAVAPDYITTSRQTLPDWIVDTSGNPPSWKWISTEWPGLLPGETVGGLWALSSIAKTTDAGAEAVYAGSTDPEVLTGIVRGPYVPNAPTVLSLITGFMGLGLTRRLRRK